RGALSDQQVVLAAHVIKDVFGEGVARYSNRLICDDAGKGNQGDLGSTTSDIHDHRSHWLFDVNSDTYGSSDRFIDHVDFLCSSMLGRVSYGSFFHLGDSRGDTDYHAVRLGKHSLFLPRDHLDQSADHLLGSVKVSNHTVF